DREDRGEVFERVVAPVRLGPAGQQRGAFGVDGVLVGGRAGAQGGRTPCGGEIPHHPILAVRDVCCAHDRWCRVCRRYAVLMTEPMIAAVPEERGRRWRVLVLFLVIGFIALCAITMSIVLGWNIGVQATVIGLAAAIL